MKQIVFLLIGLAPLSVFGQNAKSNFDGPAWKAPYSLPMDGWSIERFLIPIDFAPKIPYTGVEDVRFTLGWGDVKSNEYWTYAFLWYINGKRKITAEEIKNNLTLYYTGLIDRNIKKRNIAPEKIIPTKVSIKRIKPYPGDLDTFSGEIEMLDYMEQKPIILHYIVHNKTCLTKDNTLLFHELSPKPFTDNVWNGINSLWKEFKCEESL